MTSLPLDSTQGRQRRAWHDITAFGQHTWSDYVGRGMTSLPLDRTHGRTTSGVACHHHLWVAHTVERRLAWNNITSFAQHTRSNNLGRDMPSPPFDSTFFERCQVWHAIIAVDQHTWSNDVRRGMTSPPSDSTHGRMTSGVALHHRPWTTHKVGYVGCGWTSPPLDSTHGRQRRAVHEITALRLHARSAMLGVACHHRPWTS